MPPCSRGLVGRGRGVSERRDPFMGRPMGLVLRDGRLAYGSGHGRFHWLARSAQRRIVGIWNPIACFFIGHDLTLFEIPQYIREPACPHCSWKPKQAPCETTGAPA
jgi:hypothetical protein